MHLLFTPEIYKFSYHGKGIKKRTLLKLQVKNVNIILNVIFGKELKFQL